MRFCSSRLPGGGPRLARRGHERVCASASALARLRYHAAEQLDQDVLGYDGLSVGEAAEYARDSYPT